MSDYSNFAPPAPKPELWCGNKRARFCGKLVPRTPASLL